MKTTTNIIRWVSRILGGFWTVFFLFFFIADLFSITDSPMNATNTNDLIMFAGIFIGLFGLILGWWRELPGGIIALAGTLIICGIRPDLMLTLYVTPLISSIGFIVVYFLDKKANTN